jgi:hypothetical protein
MLFVSYTLCMCMIEGRPWVRFLWNDPYMTIGLQ